MANITIDDDALQSLGAYFERFPDASASAMRMSINGIAKGRGMALIRREMRSEIDFGASYLTGDRIGPSKLASNTNLEATITARRRPTSLARFVSGPKRMGAKGGVRLRVKKGKTSYFKNAWLVRLKKGASLSDDNYNVGLAIRLGPGETLSNKRTLHQSWLVRGKVALLYGPSVNQVFSSVSEKVQDRISDMIVTEYLRQMGRGL